MRERTLVRVLIGAALSMFALQACSFGHGAIEGVVVDERTGQPIEGAVVIATWNGSNWAGLLHSQSVCTHLETAWSGKDGRYTLPGWFTGPHSRNLTVSGIEVTVSAHKPGFMHGSQPDEPTRVRLQPFRGSPDEYMKYLDRVARRQAGCGMHDGSRRNEYRLLHVVAEEMAALAQTREHQEMLYWAVRGRDRLLVNTDKPYVEDTDGRIRNAHPGDSYRKEDLLK
jgi:hypothetical protein